MLLAVERDPDSHVLFSTMMARTIILYICTHTAHIYIITYLVQKYIHLIIYIYVYMMIRLRTSFPMFSTRVPLAIRPLGQFHPAHSLSLVFHKVLPKIGLAHSWT